MTILSNHQKDILTLFSESESLVKRFYFTGGTALSEYYLHHRVSEDLDFFSDSKFDPQVILGDLATWSSLKNFTIQSEFIDPTYVYFLNFTDGERLKIDFAPYPFTKLGKQTVHEGVLVDSLDDIAANKLLALNQRQEVKDYVDMFFLMTEKNYSFWDLKDAVLKKFRVEIEPYIFARDILVTLDFEYLPKMLKPLSLANLKDFYKDLSLTLGKKSTTV